MNSVRFVHTPAPLAEALAAQAAALGMEVADSGHGASVVYLGSDERWADVVDHASERPTVVVLPEPDIDQYVRGLAAGAGVVQLDTPTSVMMEVVVAAIRGEALVPMTVTQALAQHVPPTKSDMVALPLSPLEKRLAGELVGGASIADLAAQVGYSERTVRRKLQGLYLKLGASNRAEAVEVITQDPNLTLT